MSHFTLAIIQLTEASRAKTQKIKVPHGGTEVVDFVDWMKNESSPPDFQVYSCIWGTACITDVKVSGCDTVLPNICTSYSFKPWWAEAFDFKCPSFPLRVHHQGMVWSLLICFWAAVDWNDQSIMGSTIWCLEGCSRFWLKLPFFVISQASSTKSWWAQYTATGLVTSMWHNKNAILLNEFFICFRGESLLNIYLHLQMSLHMW